MSTIYTKPVSKYLANTRILNLLGETFGRLLVIQYVGKRGSNPRWLCACRCSASTVVNGGDLRRTDRGAIRSCGCLRHEVNRRKAVIHGEKRNGKESPEYSSYTGARKRCNCPTNRAYAKYGGRGIEFRFASFEGFLTELGRKPSPEYSLDRIDNNGHYEKGNVRWATPLQQTSNRSITPLLTIKGKTEPVSYWTRLTGIARQTISYRKRHGWCDDCTVHLPTNANEICPHKI